MSIPNSSEVAANDIFYASDYNNLRKDIFPYITDSGAGIGSGKFFYPDGENTFAVGSCSDISTALVVACAIATISAGGSGYSCGYGNITNTNWNFDIGRIGTPAYLGTDGYPTQNAPRTVGHIEKPVGIIIGTQSLWVIIDMNYTEV